MLVLQYNEMEAEPIVEGQCENLSDQIGEILRRLNQTALMLSGFSSMKGKLMINIIRMHCNGSKSDTETIDM